MNDVPETGSMPVSPMTRTAMAPSMNVVRMRTEAKTRADRGENPPMEKITIMAMKVTPMKMGMCLSGHSYQPLPSMYSWLASPLKADPMSVKMSAKVRHILNRPNIPPPTIAPMAMVRTVFAKAIIWSAAEPPLAYS